MTGTAVILMCLLLTFSVALNVIISHLTPQQPACGDMSMNHACPLNYSPVCGNDGVTYPNECALCVHRLHTNSDVLIVKEGGC
uniref:Kazal-like domain-containing protein n=1 Tax=Astyanax mexicanus TaxID=7994 RepID=A0A8B9K2Y0_ASTMX